MVLDSQGLAQRRVPSPKDGPGLVCNIPEVHRLPKVQGHCVQRPYRLYRNTQSGHTAHYVSSKRAPDRSAVCTCCGLPFSDAGPCSGSGRSSPAGGSPSDGVGGRA